MKTVCCALVCLIGGVAAAKEVGFDPPRKMSTRDVGRSDLVTPQRPIRETCWGYDGSALLWREDPGQKGIEHVTIRRGRDPVALCASRFTGSSRTITILGWPLGRAGPYLFVQDEPLGNLALLDVFDLDTGRKMFDTQRDVLADLVISKQHDTVSLQLRVGLELPCVPATADAHCWQQIRTANHIPETVALSAPDCAAAFRKEPTTRTEPRGLAVSVPAEIPDLASPKLRFLPGAARCEALP